MGLIEKDFKTYANIISDGSIRIKCDENDEKAVKRDWELKDGTKGTKFERVYKGISGMIIDISFHDADFGKMLHVTFESDEDGKPDTTLTLNTNSNFAQDLMKKLPNVDLNKKVSLSPYSFEDDKGKIRKGIVVWQGEDGKKEKIQSFFYDPETQKATNGIPVPQGDTKKFDSDDWKMYFTVVKKFLVSYIEEKIIYNFSIPQEKTTPVATADDIKEDLEQNGGVPTPQDDGEIKVEGKIF